MMHIEMLIQQQLKPSYISYHLKGIVLYKEEKRGVEHAVLAEKVIRIF